MLKQDQIRKVGFNILSSRKDTKKLKLDQDNIVEWIRCRNNPLYYIYNYVKFEEINGGISSYQEGKNFHIKHKRFIRTAFKYNKAILMASRQLGKSTIAAAFLSWFLNFYPRSEPIILNFQKDAAFGNLRKIKFIINNLPDFLKLEILSKSELKSYFELSNGSIAKVFYPSTTHAKSTLARSLTSSILYIDEAAHIPGMFEIFGSAQQTLSKAREQAIKRNLPYAIIITSTPNGIEGDGKWFYERWSNSISSDLLFKETEDNVEEWNENCEELIADPSKNGFISIKYHWSEDSSKDENWYTEQCRELDDRRKINQELDLIFVGSSNCIFEDDLLSKFKSMRPIGSYNCPYETTLQIYEKNLNPKDFYIIGVDTARSLSGVSAFNSIEVFSFLKFHQIAEFNYRIGSFSKYGEIIDSIFRWLRDQIGDNIILAIENNSIGLAPIEELLRIKDIDYTNYMYKEPKAKEWGISTTGITKDLMIGCLTEIIKEEPLVIKSQHLINQLSAIERSRGGNISSDSFCDLFMASSFCAYVRKMKAIEILPLIQLGPDVVQAERYEMFKSSVSTNSLQTKQQENFDNLQENEIEQLMILDLERNYNHNEDDILSYYSPLI